MARITDLEYVKENIYNIMSIKDHVPSVSASLYAVKRNPALLEFARQTTAVKSAALDVDGMCLIFVDPYARTREDYRRACTQNPAAAEFHCRRH